MPSTATSNSFKCDYLHLHTSPIPHAFSNEQAELVHVNEQIRSLDSHIAQLKTLRQAFHRRSRQLHNLLAPIHALPVEVLSCIFQCVDSAWYSSTSFGHYLQCLAQSLLLSTVSAHFRHVAFGTPELWKRVPLHLTDSKSIDEAASLIQHCMSLTASISIAVIDRLAEEQARSAIQGLFTSCVTRRIKAFELRSIYAPHLWMEKLRGPSFPILDTLDIICSAKNLSVDLGTLSTVTRLSLCGGLDPSSPIIIPPSVLYLNFDGVLPQVVVPILYQCQNLEECHVRARGFSDAGNDAQFSEPLTLTHLKRLTVDAMKIVTTASSAQNLQLPSLKYLQIRGYNGSEFFNAVQFSRNVSSTLTTLVLYTVHREITHDDLYQLCRLPFPKLKKLGFAFHSVDLVLSAIRVLTQRAEECDNVQPHYLPSLTTLVLHCDDELEPRCLLSLLEKWKVGEASYFHLKVKGYILSPGDWFPEVKEELRSILGARQVEVTWGRFKIQ